MAQELPAPWDVGRKRRRPLERHIDAIRQRLKDLPKDHPEFPHGLTGYGAGCKCVICIDARVKYDTERRRRRGAVARRPPQHGSRSMYTNYGCRCVKCCRANTRYIRKHRKAAERRAQRLVKKTGGE